VAYALLTPPFQTFDENQHLYRAWQISSLQLTGKRRGSQSGGELPPGLAVATLKEIGSVVPQGERRVVVRPFSQIFNANTPIGQDRPPVYYDFFGAVVYSPAGYVPQVLAIRIGEGAGLSVEWTLRIGRLLNSALCIALVCWALKLIPFGGWVMLIIALLPPTAAGTASFGQDGLAIGCGFLLTALGLKIAVDRRWSARKFAIVTLAGVAVTMSKIVYLPLVMVPALPKPSGISLRQWMSPPLLITTISAALLFAWMQVNAQSIVTFLPELPTISEQVSRIIANPFGYVALIARTYVRLLPFLWAGFYRFGDSTVPINLLAALPGTASIFLIMIYGEDRAGELTATRRAWLLVIFAAVAILIATAVFVSFTRPGALYISGIQGRYFLPALPLAAIALTRRRDAALPLLLAITFALVVVAHVMTLETIVRTFYSF
jgi:uncharacterized membrane protein